MTKKQRATGVNNHQLPVAFFYEIQANLPLFFYCKRHGKTKAHLAS